MSNFAHALARVLAIAAVMFITQAASAKTGDWDQVANIKEAATHLGNIQKRQGATKAFDFIIACYKTQGLASKYSKYFEACIAQDYIHTQTLALIYSRMPPDALKKMRVPTPQQLSQAMGQRVTGAFQKYSIPVAEAEAFKKLVDKYGFPTFASIVFPKGVNSGDAKDDTKDGAKDSEKNGTP
jgi:hypothetical protein